MVVAARDDVVDAEHVDARRPDQGAGHSAHAALAQDADEDLAVARPVELAEEDPLPAAERELAVADRDEDLRAHERSAHVRGGVRPRVLGVLPVPPLVDDLLERVLEVLRDERVGVLVDRDARRRVRDVDERRRAPFASPSAAWTCSVMSTSWVLRSVLRVISCTGLS